MRRAHHHPGAAPPGSHLEGASLGPDHAPAPPLVRSGGRGRGSGARLRLAGRPCRCPDLGLGGWRSAGTGGSAGRRRARRRRCPGATTGAPRGRHGHFAADAGDPRQVPPAAKAGPHPPSGRSRPAQGAPEHLRPPGVRPAMAARPGPLWLLGLALCALGSSPGPRPPHGCSQRRLGARERRDMQREILAVLGLPGRPRLRALPAAARLPASAPLFMLDLYHAMAGDDDEDAGPPGRRLGRADLVMSFVNMGECSRGDAVRAPTLTGHSLLAGSC